jgi:hypothetical protein
MGRFKSGESGNPKGKPKGTLHKATRAAQELLDGEGEAITRKAIEKALEGDSIALRLCLERIIPPRRDRPMSLQKLPKIRGVADIPKVMEAVLKAVAQGEITPGEGQAMATMLEAYRKGVELSDFEARLTALEERTERA